MCEQRGVPQCAPQERRSRHAGGEVSVPPCVPLLQPLAPVALQVGAGARLLAAEVGGVGATAG